MKKSTYIIGIIIVILLIGVNASFYVVDQTEYAIIIELGKPRRVVLDPGLHVKIPFIQQIVYFDNRILEYDAAPAEILTKDKKNLVVDNYSKWKIKDPLKMYQTVKSEIGAQSRLDDIIYSQLRVELGRHNLLEIVSEAREDIMKKVIKKSKTTAPDYGIDVVDVRIKRADLPPENERYVFERMKAERERQAKKYRSEGQEESLKVKAGAEKERTIILAEAYKESEQLKGDGDAKAIKIYAQAFEQDPDFYRFIRSLDAYKKSLKQGTVMILSPEMEFFKHLREGR
ncbi:MAG: protease modulator HflC [Thermodesulfobacteriota bacterium]|nr:protease modulator HflC [Thermodesulfobacteriota bacterium]